MGRKKKEIRCRECIYRSEHPETYGCDYCLLTGHTRLAAPALGCKFFVEGERTTPQRDRIIDWDRVRERDKLRRQAAEDGRSRRKVRRKRYDWDKAMQLYKQGMLDSEIARELGCGGTAVHTWRREHNLPVQKRPKQEKKSGKLGATNAEREAIDRRRLEYVQAGMSDKQIAKLEGVCQSSIQRWRRARGLESNTPAPNKCDWTLGRKLYAEGKTDREVAEALGCTQIGAGKWRREHHIEYKGRQHYELDWSGAMPLYERGMTDGQIAEALGRPRQGVGNWRRRNQLPPNGGE